MRSDYPKSACYRQVSVSSRNPTTTESCENMKASRSRCVKGSSEVKHRDGAFCDYNVAATLRGTTCALLKGSYACVTWIKGEGWCPYRKKRRFFGMRVKAFLSAGWDLLQAVVCQSEVAGPVNTTTSGWMTMQLHSLTVDGAYKTNSRSDFFNSLWCLSTQ